MPRKRHPQRQEWLDACKYHQGQIKRYERMISPHGEKWKRGMIRHHERKLAELAELEPPKFLEA
jgi:hypothetical protein